MPNQSEGLEPSAGFLHRLIDWRDFEEFVRQLYADDPQLIVERNVIETGKSGAKRQIDVRFTHHVKSHQYTTIVECKRWNEPVDRQRVDELYTTLEDLNANKGVIFTTTGFDAGAQKYAHYHNIDLFLVRDLTAREWGRPGRIVWFYLQYWAAQIGTLRMPDAQLLSYPGRPTDIDLNLTLGPNAAIDERLTLYDDACDAGPNLMVMLLMARERALEILSQSIGLIEDGNDEARASFVMPVVLDVSQLEHRSLRLDQAVLKPTTLSFDLLVSLHQSRMRFDRGAKLDLAVAVENFVTKERHVAVRHPGSEAVPLFPLRVEAGEDDPDVLQNGSLIRVFLEAFVRAEVGEDVARQPGVRISLPGWEIARVSEPPTLS